MIAMYKLAGQCGLLMAVVVGSTFAAKAADVEQFFPSETEVVVSINVKQVLDSPMGRKNTGRMQDELKKIDVVQSNLEALGFDPFHDLSSITLAGAGGNDNDKLIIVVKGKFDKAKFQAKADELAKGGDEIVKIIKSDGKTFYETNIPGQSKPFFVALLDGATLVASPARGMITDAYEISAGTKKTALKKEVEELLRQNDPNQSVALAALGTAVSKGLPQLEKIRSLRGGMTVEDDIKLELVIAATDTDAGKEFAKTLKDGLDQAKGLLSQSELAPLAGVINALKVSEAGSVVTVKGQISREVLEKIQKK
jgi:hypothetical protein